MIGLLGGLALLAAPTVTLRSAGVAGRLLDGPIPVLVDVNVADAEAGAGALRVDYVGIDGDTVQHALSIPIVPGSQTSHWIMIDPPAMDAVVTASLIDAEGDILALAKPMRLDVLGEPLGNAGGTLTKPSMLLIVGTDRLGLEAAQLGQGKVLLSEPLLPLATNVESIPPSASALRGVNTIVWGDGGPPDEPLARAILQWVDTGGHLVLTPPAMGAPWGTGTGPLAAASGLDAIVPAPLVDASDLSAMFDQPVAGDAPLLAELPETTPWRVIRRSRSGVPLITRTPLGTGHITALAVDPSRRALASIETRHGTVARLGLAETWGPVLARRDLPSVPLVRRIEQDDRFRKNLLSNGTALLSDRLVYDRLRRSTSVSSRLLLTTVFAVGYLLIAALALWRVLRRRRQTTWVWPAFGAAGLVFALAAWLLGSALMPSVLHVQHFTVLDHVAGADDHLARSWLDLQLPGTGNRQIMVRNDNPASARIAPWRSIHGATQITFGDVRRLPPRTTDDALHVIARNANTRVRVDWRGTASPELWGHVLSSSPDNPIHADDSELHGTLVNRLPVALTDVSLIWITGDATVRADDGLWRTPDNAGHPLVRGQWWRIGRLEPGAAINLDAIEISAQSDLLHAVHSLQNSWQSWSRGQINQHDWPTLMSVYSLLTPPPWARPTMDPNASQRETHDRLAVPEWSYLARDFARDLDLGPWLASPALIVLGWADVEALPFPLLVDGEAPEAIDGEVLVRWIMPLEGDTVGETN